LTVDAQTITALENIAYALIEAMGMQAENQVREQRGEAMAFPRDAFISVAEGMRDMVRSMLG
jgi:hypothetical protein